MKNTLEDSIIMVDYLDGSAVVHEFMSVSKYAQLEQLDRNGNVHIMNHSDPVKDLAA